MTSYVNVFQTMRSTIAAEVFESREDAIEDLRERAGAPSTWRYVGSKAVDLSDLEDLSCEALAEREAPTFATSPLLNLPPRTLEQAQADIEAQRALWRKVIEEGQRDLLGEESAA